MTQLIFLISGLMVIAGVIILTGHLNRRKHERSSLATLTDATTEQVERFVRDNLGKWADVYGCAGWLCGYDKCDNDIILGSDNGWICPEDNIVILKKYTSYLYACVSGNLSLIKITERP